MKSKYIKIILINLIICLTVVLIFTSTIIAARRPLYKPLLTGKYWMAITGLLPSATSGAQIFIKGGNAVDAAAAMLASEAVQHSGTGFGGESQTLVFDPNKNKVFGINGMGVAPTGMTADYFIEKGMPYPPNYGVDSATTPGIPGGLMTMVAEFGQLSLKEVLEPALELASNGYVVTESRGANLFKESNLEMWKDWKYSSELFIPRGKTIEYGEIFVQTPLANTFRKLIATEQQALANGASRKEAIYAAYDRFYKGDIAAEYCRGSQLEGGLHTMEDLANWTCYIEDPPYVNYHGIDVYTLDTWTQGPVLLQMLNLLEGIDLESMEHNSVEYIHTLYQVMNIAYADRDFYYGDPYLPPEEPLEGLLSKEYAAERRKLINPDKNEPGIGPGDPYKYQEGDNPYLDYVKQLWVNLDTAAKIAALPFVKEDWIWGTSSVQAADATGWVVSMTPSGAWPPAVIAGETGVPMSQRAQSFVADPAINPYNVVQPGQRPRVTLTPAMALKDGKPFLSFSLPGGDFQNQALLMLFLNMVHFEMNVQEAAEAPKFRSFGMHSSFGAHTINPGRILLDARIPQDVVDGLEAKGYDVQIQQPGVYSNPAGIMPGNLTAVYFNREYGTLEGSHASDYSGRFGIAW